MLPFEQHLPSTKVKQLAINAEAIKVPDAWIGRLEADPSDEGIHRVFEEIKQREQNRVEQYIADNKERYAQKYSLPLTRERIQLLALYYCRHALDMDGVIETFNHYYEQIKSIEIQFLKNNAINIVFEEEAVDYIIEGWIRNQKVDVDAVYRQMANDFQHGLKLVRDKTGRNRFFMTRQALDAPEEFIRRLLVNPVGSVADMPSASSIPLGQREEP